MRETQSVGKADTRILHKWYFLVLKILLFQVYLLDTIWISYRKILSIFKQKFVNDRVGKVSIKFINIEPSQ